MNPRTRLIVTGSRRWDDADRIEQVLKGVREQEHFADAVLVHGAARGVDQMAAGADLCLAFSRDASAGCADCVRRAQQAGIPVLFFDYEAAADEGVWI